MKVHTIKTNEDLNAHKGLWQKVLENHRGVRHPFLDFDWISTYSKHFLNNDKLQIFICHNGDNTAILPFHSTYKGYRHLEFIGKGISDYADLITNSADFPQMVDIFINNKVDSIKLFNVRDDSPLSSMIKLSAFDISNGGYIMDITDSVKSPYIDLYGKDWNTYFNSLKGKFKIDLRRRLRKILSLGELEFGHCNNLDEVTKITNVMYEQHIRRRQYLGQDKSIFSNKRMKDFFHELNRKLFLSSKLILFYLKFNRKVIAIVQCFLYDDILYHYIPTFDVEYNQYSPGRILNQHIIKYSIENHFKEIDFMIGDEAYKLEWNVKLRQTKNIFFFKKNVLGKAAFFEAKAKSCVGKIKIKLANTKLREAKRIILKGLYKLGL